MLGKGGLVSPLGDGWESGSGTALGIVAVFLQVFDPTDGPCLNFLVICHFISCQVFNFCLLEVTPLWTSPHSNWICHRNRTVENFIFFFPAWRQASRQGTHTSLLGSSSLLSWLCFLPFPPAFNNAPAIRFPKQVEDGHTHKKRACFQIVSECIRLSLCNFLLNAFHK